MPNPFTSSATAGPASTSPSAFPLPSHSKQFLMELTDYSLTSLIRQCRSPNPAKRPKMMMVVMQLQQMLVRHVVSGLGSRVGTDVARKMICSGPPLPSSPAMASISQPSSLELALQKDPMSAPLSSYLPKKNKAMTSPAVEHYREKQRDEQHHVPYQGISRAGGSTHSHSQEVDYTRTMPALVPATASYATYPSSSLHSESSRLSSSLPTTSSFPTHDIRYGAATHVPQVVFQPPSPLPRDTTTRGYMQQSESQAWTGATNSWEAPSGGFERRRMSNAGLVVPAYYGGTLDNPWSGSNRGTMGMYRTSNL
ncbi:hypothetical protein CPB86DRAFT_183548 [Serendipita vermifera]|nr:hypothetical protein CPB86DRAFT_183548 [Serendipita vermifera]